MLITIKIKKEFVESSRIFYMFTNQVRLSDAIIVSFDIFIGFSVQLWIFFFVILLKWKTKEKEEENQKQNKANFKKVQNLKLKTHCHIKIFFL